MDMLKKHKKRVWLLIIVVAAICTLTVVSTLTISSISKGKIAGLLDLGSKYLAELDYEQAVVSYLAAIEIDPKCEEAYMGIAEAYLQMGEYGKAMEYAMEGYSQTGDGRLLEKAEMLQALADMTEQGEDMVAGSSVDILENAGSQDVSEEEAAYGERIVDGIYHHGYTFYDLSDEETALLDELISYTEAGRYEEYAVMLNTEEYIQAWEELAINKHEINSGGSAHIAYNGYKIYAYNLRTIYYGGSGYYIAGVCLIPIEDGMGALYSWSDNREDGEYVYTYCECEDGMFNGTLWGSSRSYCKDIDGHYMVGADGQRLVNEDIVEGEVVNGLMNGRFSQYCSRFNTGGRDVDGDGFEARYSTFDHGRVAEFSEEGEGELGYCFREDGVLIGDIVVRESFEEARDALMAAVFYILPMGYYKCSDVTSPVQRYVGEESGVCIYPY